MDSKVSTTTLPKYLQNVHGQAVVIEWRTVKDLCPVEAKALQAALARPGLDDLDLASLEEAFRPDGPAAGAWPDGRLQMLTTFVVTEVMSAWWAFKDATAVGESGLTLGIGFCASGIDPECEGDSPEGVYYTVQRAYQLSPAGAVLNDQLTVVCDVLVIG
jgi:hypothetical protein